ncbi:3494_t:CDS:2 [Ambispora gerdemannii]|uniref:3494_t:CDS:1 n=1 Tax=Ambispora gerdemannii TaxID=144530 RepID=A0A9N9FQG6_9GLOM|nr:3494_t:CDS:2 [Ambispora gerdemannii]
MTSANNIDIDKYGAIIRYDDTFVNEKRNHQLTLPRQSAPTKTKKRARKTIPSKFASSSSFSSMSSISLHKNNESLVKVPARPNKRYINLEACMTLTKAEYNKFRSLGNLAVSSFLNIEFPLDSQTLRTLKASKNMIFSSYPALSTRRDSWVVDELVQSIFANKRRYFRQKQQKKEFNILEIEFQFEITEEKELENITEEENKKLENTTEKEIKNLENTTEEEVKEIDYGYEIVVSLPTTDEEDEN